MTSDLQKKLDDLRAQRLIDEVADENPDAKLQQQIDDEIALQAAAKQHGKVGRGVHAVYTPIGAVIVRKPTRLQYRDFQANENRSEAVDVLVHACLVHPDHKTYESIISEFPGIEMSLSGAISLLAGVSFENSAGK